ncbi:MAG: polysaccharide biosynthesis tyrosine autokinase, partial [Bacteroidota bacterium]
YATPIYSSAGTLQIKSEQQGGGRNDKFEEVFVNSRSSNIQSEIEVLKSRPLMERVINKLGLQFSYAVVGKIKTLNIYKQGPFIVEPFQITDSSRAFSLKIKFLNDREFRINDDKTTIPLGQYFKNSYGIFKLTRNPKAGISKEYIVNWQPAYSAAGAYAGGLQIVPKNSGTGILILSLETTNSQMGADIINKLMEEYGNYSIEQKIKSSDQIISFIDARLDDIGEKRDSVQKIYLDLQIKYNLFDIDIQSTNYFNNISGADKELNEQKLNLNVADMVDSYLADKRNEFTKVIVPSSLGLDDATLNELIASYNKAQLDRQQLLDANVTADNPAVIEINGQIEKIRISIRENLKNIKSSINSIINETKRISTESETQLKALPLKTKELAEIKQRLEAYQSLYTLLQTKKEETAISRASTIPNSGIIDRAYATNYPVKPNRRSIQILAILLGIGLPALLIFIGEILNDKVTTRFDIEKITAAPILGEIGHSYSSRALIVNKTTRSMVAEQFRIIRSNLQYILNKVDRSVLLVTSSFSGEGKSYVSTNMGAVLALAGKKTIILEFDIRKPKILSGLGISKGPGITNYLVGKAELNDLIKPVPDQENLFVLGCGPVPPNPAELLLDQRVEEMFTWLRSNFDVVIIDTAPVGMVSDAMTLSKFADATLYLVRQGHTFKKQVAMIDEFYLENKLPKVSIIINDVKMKPGYGYYGYGRYGYGYGYGYGSYYEEEAPPPNLLEKILGWLDIRRLFDRTPKK